MYYVLLYQYLKADFSHFATESVIKKNHNKM